MDIYSEEKSAILNSKQNGIVSVEFKRQSRLANNIAEWVFILYLLLNVNGYEFLITLNYKNIIDG